MEKLEYAIALSKILASDKTAFYASDFDIYGSTMNALRNRGYIEPTGNTKEVFITLWDNHYLKVTAKEWKLRKINTRLFNEEISFFVKRCKREMEEMQEFIDFCKNTLGIK